MYECVVCVTHSPRFRTATHNSVMTFVRRAVWDLLGTSVEQMSATSRPGTDHAPTPCGQVLRGGSSEGPRQSLSPQDAAVPAAACATRALRFPAVELLVPVLLPFRKDRASEEHRYPTVRKAGLVTDPSTVPNPSETRGRQANRPSSIRGCGERGSRRWSADVRTAAGRFSARSCGMVAQLHVRPP